MKVTTSEIEKYIKLLEETTHRIANTSKDVDDARLLSKPDKKSWSVNDIFAHLRSCADVWGQSIESILAEDNPTLPDVHPRQWIKETDYRVLTFRESFQAFTAQREKLLMILKKLSFADWSRGAMIDGRRHTVFSQTRRMAKHENEHCEQIEEFLKPKNTPAA